MTLFLLTPVFIFGQITYFNSASAPTDPGTSTSTTLAVAPPGSMQTGDLVIIIAQRRASNTTTMAISANGGQVWTTETSITGTSNVSARIFWCRFNGTWTGGNPSVSSMGTASTVVMHVFRPSKRINKWAVDVAQVTAQITAAAAKTITGGTTDNRSTVTLAAWFTADDNSWGTLTGTGWVVTGSAQYRNTSGSDQSSSYAHKITTTAGAVGAVTKTQTANGNDVTRTAVITFFEYQNGMPLSML